MFRMIENTWDAVSCLGSLPFVEDVNGFGVCQGGLIVTSAVVTDRRIEKPVTVAAIIAIDAAFAAPEAREAIISSANAARLKLYETGEPMTANLNGFHYGDGMSLEEVKEMNPGNPAVDEYFAYYGQGGTGGLGTLKNFTHSQMADVNMSSIHSIGEVYADKITQPSLAIYGEKSPLAFASQNFVKRLTNEHEVMALTDHGQIEFYHEAGVIELVADAAAKFLKK